VLRALRSERCFGVASTSPPERSRPPPPPPTRRRLARRVAYRGVAVEAPAEEGGKVKILPRRPAGVIKMTACCRHRRGG
jgi:hypothetical protein